jgi:PPOX class probable F420-dependent enzyme
MTNPTSTLTEQARRLLAAPNFAVVATANADGSTQQSVVWVKEHDGQVIFSTLSGRAKHRNLERDPTIGVLVMDRANGYCYSEIRGRAHLEYEDADALIDELSSKYTGQGWTKKQARPRVTVVVTPARVTDYEE